MNVFYKVTSEWI